MFAVKGYVIAKKNTQPTFCLYLFIRVVISLTNRILQEEEEFLSKLVIKLKPGEYAEQNIEVE